MPRPEFSEMLVERRRELGLSIQQASHVLRLREEVLQAFEDGDWRRMPQGGYAQGMLSSYARYLGLDAKTVVDQYAADLYDATHAPARESSRRPRETRGASASSSAGRERRQDHGAPTRRGTYASGRAVYGSEGGRRSHDAGGDSRREAEAPRMRRYTSREGMERHGASSARSRTTQARAGRRPMTAASDPEFDRYGAGPGHIERRRVEADEYVDDLRYDDRAESYEAASSYDGRMSSRNIAQVSRPNVRRQPSRERQRERSGAPRKTRHDGFLGFLEAFFSDSRRTMIFIMVVVGLILTVVIIGSVSSCVSAQSSTGRSTVDVSTSDSDDSSSDSSSDGSSDSSDSSSDADRQQAAAEATAKRQAQEEQEANTETKVKVSVADGQVSWVEIDCDGTSEVAETITGPWEKEYTVTDSITIQVSDTTAVTVTKNGETQKIEGKASGIGSITIEGTNPQAASSDSSGSADSSDDGSGSSEGSSSKSSSGSSTATGSSSSSAASSSKKTSSASGTSKTSN